MKILVFNHFFEQDLDSLLQVAAGKHDIRVLHYSVLGTLARKYFPDPVFRQMDACSLPEYQANHKSFVQAATQLFDTIYQQFPFDMIVSPSDVFIYIRDWVTLAQKRGIPFIVVQKETTISSYTMENHSQELGRWFPFIGDLMLVCSERHKQFWVKANAPASKIVVTGQPRFDFYRQPERWKNHAQLELVFSQPRPTILFFSYDLNSYAGGKDELSPWQQLRAETEETLISIVREGKYNLLIKPHPQQQGHESYLPNLQKMSRDLWGKSILFVWSREIDTRQLIVNADVIVGFQTTALFEAMIAGKRVAYTFWSDPVFRQLNNIIPFHQMGEALYVANSPDQLRNFILSDEDRINGRQKQHRQQFFNEYLGPLDGKASERALRIIEEWVAKYAQILQTKEETERRLAILVPAKPKKVIFFSPYGSWLIHNQVDAIVASALRLRGCEVLVIGCDGIYGKECCILPYISEPQRAEVCQGCSQTGQQFFNQSFQLPYQQLRNFIVAEDYLLANQWVETLQPEDYAHASYKNIPIGQWVVSSVYSHFRISVKGLSRPEVRTVHKQYLRDGLITYLAVSRLLDTYRPTNVFLFNGRFLPYRIAFEVAKQRQLDVILHERGFLADSFAILDNHPCTSTKSQLTCVKAWEAIPMVESELHQVKHHFTHREQGKDLSWPAFYAFRTDYATIRHQLRIPMNARIVAVFTSSEDELAATAERQGVLEQFEIIARLIDIFANREEYLVIRHHPNIGGQPMGGMMSMSDTHFITSAYRQALFIPKNVRIIMPSERLTSYALLWHTSAAITFFSTIAIEAAARGVPTAVMEASSYQVALRHVIRKTDQESLAKLVDELLTDAASYPQMDDLRRLYRFTHAYFFKSSNKFRSFGVKNTHHCDVRIKSFEELQPGNDPALDRVCNRILQGSPLSILPGETDQNRRVREEDTFLQQEQLELKQRRQLIREQTLQRQHPVVHEKVGVICLQYQGEEEPNQLFHAWLNRSRHNQIAVYYCNNLELENDQQVTDALLTVLEKIQENYILVTHSLIQYDEAFLATALDILSAEGSDQVVGVLAGAYLASLERGIEQEIFTRRTPNLTYQQAIGILPSLQYVPTLLGFTLIRREALISMLTSVREGATTSVAAERLFGWLHGPHIHQFNVPMLVIHQTSRIESYPEWVSLSRQSSKHEETYQMKTPVAFLIFNRPDTTAKVFEAIRQARPPKLLVIADGPRLNKPDEAGKCIATRAIINRVDWPCEVLTNYSETNLGCRHRVASGLTWVFNTVEEAIILEDDCLPHPTFFRFCEELLEKYRYDERVMAISGDNFQYGQKRGSYSYYFSRYNHIWGWASWRRAWRWYDLEMKAWPQARDRQWLASVFNNNPKAVQHWSNIFQAAYQGFNTWDYAWTFTCWLHNGLTILPSVNLISNIGFGPEATHTLMSGSPLANMPIEAMPFPLQHPPTITRDVEADDFTERTHFGGGVPIIPSTTVPIESLVQQAINHLNANQNQEALSLLNQVLQNQPELVSLYYGKAVALTRLGRVSEAVETLNRLLVIVPTHEKGKQLLAQLRATSSTQEIHTMLQQAVELLNTGKKVEALRLAEKAVSKGVFVPGLHYLRAVCSSAVGRYEEALEAAKQELEKNPSHVEAQKQVEWLTKALIKPKLAKIPTDQRPWNTTIPRDLIMSIQNAHHNYSYRGVPLLKNPFDFALYPLLIWNLKPRTLIEIGSKSGGSGLWLGDLLNNFDIDGHVYSLDIVKVAHLSHPRVTFIEGDGQALQNSFSVAFLNSLPRPFLVIEDADHSYETSKSVLDFFHSHLEVGDYIIVEDGIISEHIQDPSYNSGPHRALKAFLAEHTGEYEIDGEYCDYFGYNITWNTNGYLKKIKGHRLLGHQPDKLPLNSILESTLVKEFFQDDSVASGISNQLWQTERFQLHYALRKLLPTTSLPVRFIQIGADAGALFLTCQALKRVTPHFQGFAIEPGNHPQFIEVLKHVQQHVTHLPMLSHQAVAQLHKQFQQDGNFPVFIFVDGDHTYEGVWRDAMDYFQLLAPGGLMVFHDYLPPLNDANREAILFHHGGHEPGIRQAFEELVECTYGEVVEIPLLSPTDPTQTQAYLPIIPGVVSTIRGYRKLPELEELPQEFGVEAQAIMQHIPPASTIVDVGSHVGNFTTVFLERNYTVISIEPLTPEIEHQRTRLANYLRVGKLHLHNVACSDKNGTAPLFIGNYTVLSSLEKRWFEDVFTGSFSGHTVTVPTIRLSDLLRQYMAKGIQVNCVKVDTEGHDYHVLLGLFEDLPATLWPAVIMFEYQTHPPARPTLENSLSLLKRHGYHEFKYTLRYGQYLLLESAWTTGEFDVNQCDGQLGPFPAGHRYGNVIARRRNLN